MKRIIFLISLLAIALSSFAQLTQTVRGTVLDKDTRSPLNTAQVFISPANLSASTAADGSFEIPNVPIGRINIEITYMGYEPVLRSNVELRSSKQLVLDIEMVEQISSIKAIVVKSKKSKQKTKNKSISVSGRTFSIDESKRYAGALNDVSRMAQNFAGVKGGDDSRNDIVVRGNTPSGILFRLEGMDIPNPNHFAVMGTTGGPVSMLNNNMLANSDFLTGAFPSEYGNAFSGAFDLSIRKGNNKKHEFLGQMAFNGFEFMAEGPLSKKNKSSYIVNARYSFLDIFDKLGINLGAGSGIPRYMDASFKLNFPNKKGYTSVFGLAGKSDIDFIHDFSDTTNLFVDNSTDNFFTGKTGVLGVKNIYKLSRKTYLRTVVGGNIATNDFSMDTLNPLDSNNFGEFIRNKSYLGKISANFMLNHKINKKNILRVGLNVQNRFFDLNESINVNKGIYSGQKVLVTDLKDNTQLLQTYGQLRHRFNNQISVNGGLHVQYLTFNHTYSVEPRFGMRYKIAKRSTLSFGYGKHSKLLASKVYFGEARDPSNKTLINKDLEMMKAHHFVLGFDQSINKHARFKAEMYYQNLYDIPVNMRKDGFSMLNFGARFDDSYPDSMQSTGTGKNMGIEFTLERFLDKGFYYLATVSLYDSKYTGNDGVERNTAFNGNYTFNTLIGKEFKFKPKIGKDGKVKANRSFLIDLKYTHNGGQRYVPIDLAKSIVAKEAVYNHSIAYAKRYKDYQRFDFKIGYKTNNKRITQEWQIDIQNILNIKNMFFETYNIDAGRIDKRFQLGMLPVGVYRITF